MLDQSKNKRTFISDSRGCSVPRIHDVLETLIAGSVTDYVRKYCHPRYVANVQLAADSVTHLGIDVTARDVAVAICELCPEEARCLFNAEYAEAARIAGRAQALNLSRSKLITMCGCKSCAGDDATPATP